MSLYKSFTEHFRERCAPSAGDRGVESKFSFHVECAVNNMSFLTFPPKSYEENRYQATFTYTRRYLSSHRCNNPKVRTDESWSLHILTLIIRILSQLQSLNTIWVWIRDHRIILRIDCPVPRARLRRYILELRPVCVVAVIGAGTTIDKKSSIPPHFVLEGKDRSDSLAGANVSCTL